jgi:hypothetical protein
MTKDDRIINTIYQFKTNHRSSPTSPAGRSYDKYEEISSSKETFYKWSNDNNVYTELSSPGFEETSEGYNVFFVGENPPFDNSLTGSNIGSPRNIAFVKVSIDQ